MNIDQDRLISIANAEYSKWSYRKVPRRIDNRLSPTCEDYLRPYITNTMRVIDLGCGDGKALLNLSQNYHTGLGIDIDLPSIQKAEEARRSKDIQNVEYQQMDFPKESDRLQPESFDMVISLRGAAPDTPRSIQASLRLLRVDGMIFCEEIGEQHNWEEDEIFDENYPFNSALSATKKWRTVLGSYGVSIRIVADLYEKNVYPDIYAWFEYVCASCYKFNMSFPQPKDPRIALFAERYTQANGEVETTAHVVWVAGIKR